MECRPALGPVVTPIAFKTSPSVWPVSVISSPCPARCSPPPRPGLKPHTRFPRHVQPHCAVGHCSFSPARSTPPCRGSSPRGDGLPYQAPAGSVPVWGPWGTRHLSWKESTRTQRPEDPGLGQTLTLITASPPRAMSLVPRQPLAPQSVYPPVGGAFRKDRVRSTVAWGQRRESVGFRDPSLDQEHCKFVGLRFLTQTSSSESRPPGSLRGQRWVPRGRCSLGGGGLKAEARQSGPHTPRGSLGVSGYRPQSPHWPEGISDAGL